jgi:hypothetical protein
MGNKMTIEEAREWMKLKSSDACPKGYPEKWHEAHGFIMGWGARDEEVEKLKNELDCE